MIPMVMMAYSIPQTSAITPDKIAPIAYPKSRHKRKTPMLSARWVGVVLAAMADKNVGYTKAVPNPKIAAIQIKL